MGIRKFLTNSSKRGGQESGEFVLGVPISQRLNSIKYTTAIGAVAIILTYGISSWLIGISQNTMQNSSNAANLLDTISIKFNEVTANVLAFTLEPMAEIYWDNKVMLHEELVVALEEVYKLELEGSLKSKVAQIKNFYEIDLKAADQELERVAFDNPKELKEYVFTSYLSVVAGISELISSTRGDALEHKLFTEKKQQNVLIVAGLALFFIIACGFAFLLFKISTITSSLSKELKFLSKEITQTSQSLEKVSKLVNDNSAEIASSATTQASGIQETLASMDQMHATLVNTAQSAKDTLDLCKEGHKENEMGRLVMNKMLDSMETIEHSTQKLDSMVKLIEELKKKTNLINTIVFESRLLSVNASIEAARAGSHGKGFAVVAEEVEKLATMSGKSAVEIQEQLELSAKNVSEIVRYTKEKIDMARKTSNDFQSAFERMGNSLESIIDASNRIANATSEQESGVKQTVDAMSDMELTTQRSITTAENMANNAKKLDLTATNLNRAVGKLNFLTTGTEIQGVGEIMRIERKTTRQETDSDISTRPKQPQNKEHTENEDNITHLTHKRNDARWSKTG